MEVTQGDSNTNDSLKGWKKNTTKSERLYVLGAAQAEASDYESVFLLTTKLAENI